ncbi:hypothetical protein PACTADRAFT_1959 [Pachysolen tannophilus NRRL Y-2460]|uniref:N-glycosylation protein EOS1 n=1 Tax=Pachysolen tannophilus NRRL Y-2460 TaxID=669874 RepID=A0A1E4U066_PACTA|nr:hypothetical protein PACTADRAFT_1959 [Pachysolen tannophilus NRRL Y-2460]
MSVERDIRQRSYNTNLINFDEEVYRELSIPLVDCDFDIGTLNEEVPSYETSQQQESERANSITSFHNNGNTNSNTITRNSSTTSFQQTVNHSSSVEISKNLNEERKNLKRVGLKFLNQKQLFGLAFGRDLSLLAIIKDLYKVLKEWYCLNNIPGYTSPFVTLPKSNLISMTNARSSEFLMAGIWCIVSGYLTYSILDSLMVRWIVIYSPSGVIFRMISMSMFIIMIIHMLTTIFNPDGNYFLHVWILISCALTLIYIAQSFVTSNLTIENYEDDENSIDDDDLGKRKKNARYIDLYNITVFAVVPVGIASFLTMIGLIRNLLILRVDIEREAYLGFK